MRTVVIGVGNPYRRDDGVGPAVADLLVQRDLPGVEVARSLGETTELIDLWQGRDLAILVDAIRAAGASGPGAPPRRRGHAFPGYSRSQFARVGPR